MDAHDIGSHIGQYRLIKKIGAGGMGTVYVGEHILLGRRAAIKTLLPLLSSKPEIVDRFFKEARATSAIPDPGVVQIFDFGYHVDGTAYIVMELLEGEALSARLDRLGRLHPAEALRIARQLAGALSAAHAAGIVHRDLKPENVFLIKDPELAGGERTKLIDFGICKLDDDARNTESGVMLGTPVYMSPEQCQGLRTLDGRSDIYGLGCVLFQVLTGRVPFDHHGHGDLIVAHLQHDPPAPSELVPELPPVVDAIVLRCLAKDPDARFQSMAALQHAIESVLPQLTPVPASPGPTALALSAGFKSRYDGNLGTQLPSRGSPTPDERPTPKWYITATPLPRDSEELAIPRTQARSLFAIVVTAAIVAVTGFAVWHAQQDDAGEASQLAAIGMAATAGSPELSPAGTAFTVRATAREPAPPPESVDEVPAPSPPATPAKATQIKPPPARVLRPTARPNPRPTIPPRQRVRPAPQPPRPAPTPPAEDLYDTR